MKKKTEEEKQERKERLNKMAEEFGIKSSKKAEIVVSKEGIIKKIPRKESVITTGKTVINPIQPELKSALSSALKKKKEEKEKTLVPIPNIKINGQEIETEPGQFMTMQPFTTGYYNKFGSTRSSMLSSINPFNIIEENEQQKLKREIEENALKRALKK